VVGSDQSALGGGVHRPVERRVPALLAGGRCQSWNLSLTTSRSTAATGVAAS
jgi:hypothetical protein